jgi:nicotinate phosphoribosyltransferase
MRDMLALADTPRPGQPLLVPFIRGGELIEPRLSLEEARAHAHLELLRLPDALRSLRPAPPYPLDVEPALAALAAEIDARS